MTFCSNCGQDLKGAMKYCSTCGYKITDAERELIKKSSEIADNKENRFLRNESSQDSSLDDDDDDDLEPAEEAAESSKQQQSQPLQSQQLPVRPPPGATVKAKLPKSTKCSVCNNTTDDICFFCDYAVCNTHSLNMQVFSDNAKFGNTIQSCPECADKKNKKQPSKDEASDIGFFFNIRPYHEWRIIEK